MTFIGTEGIHINYMSELEELFTSVSLYVFPKSCVLTRHRRRGVFMLL